MSTISTNANPNYEALKFYFLKEAEGQKLTAYADSENIPTIGIGLNLTAGAGTNLRNVLTELKIRMEDKTSNE